MPMGLRIVSEEFSQAKPRKRGKKWTRPGSTAKDMKKTDAYPEGVVERRIGAGGKGKDAHPKGGEKVLLVDRKEGPKT